MMSLWRMIFVRSRSENQFSIQIPFSVNFHNFGSSRWHLFIIYVFVMIYAGVWCVWEKESTRDWFGHSFWCSTSASYISKSLSLSCECVCVCVCGVLLLVLACLLPQKSRYYHSTTNFPETWRRLEQLWSKKFQNKGKEWVQRVRERESRDFEF